MKIFGVKLKTKENKKMEKLGNIKLYNCDCMELLKQTPDNYYDLALVDPPYGINRDYQNKTICKNPKHNRKEHIKSNWDNDIPNSEYFNELFRISKNQIIWGANYFTKNLFPSMGWIVWYKGQQGLSMSDCEIAYTSFNRAARLVIINRAELIKQSTFHPTEKPIKLYKWLLKNYAKQGDKILDTHFGSLSIGIACHDLGFDLTACELDKDYYEAGKKRLIQHQQQLTIF